MKYLGFLLLIVLYGCSNSSQNGIQILELDISKSSIPEGIAIHPTTKEIFLSSVHEDRITKSSADGHSNDIILERKMNGYSFGVGMDIWNNKLYALGKKNRKHQSILSIIDLNTNELKTIHSTAVDTTFFNDLAIDQKGNCYITDTDNHNIYFYNVQTDAIEVFLNTERIRHPNGIAISSDGTKLFIDSWTTGIKILELATKKILNADHPATTKKGIDGLKYQQGKLYFIKNGGRSQSHTHGLYSIELLNAETDLGAPDPLVINHEMMHLPTTLSIVDDSAYILANSQMDRLDQEEHEIINRDSLTNTFVLKYLIE